MLLLFILHIVITTICLWTGYFFYTSILKSKNQKPVIFYGISGLILLTMTSQVAALFISVNIYFFASILFCLVLLALIKWGQCKAFFSYVLGELSSLPGYTKALLILLWVMIVFINSGPVMMDDTESYHIQMIKWIQEYGSVQGIVNLHERYGFNSSWFSSVALFGSISDKLNLFTTLNAVLSIWLCYHLIISMIKGAREKEYHSTIAFITVLIFSLAAWPVIRGNAATANYDFIKTLLFIVLFTQMFMKRNDTEDQSLNEELLIWPVYLFTVRIVNFPLLLLSLFAFYALIKNKNWKSLLISMTCCLVLVIPFLWRNIIVSGYPFYPSAAFNFFNNDWKADPKIMENVLEYIKYYNRVSTAFLDIEQTKALGSGWIPVWFRYLFQYDKLIFIPGIIGITLSYFALIRPRYNTSSQFRFLIFTSMVSIVSWFFIAPDPRFVYGILLAGVFMLAYYGITFINKQFLQKLIVPIFILLVISTGIYSVIKIVKNPSEVSWIKPTALPQPPVTEINLNGIILRIPEKINGNWNSRCYGTELPCLYIIDSRLEARGKNISEGFRLKK